MFLVYAQPEGVHVRGQHVEQRAKFSPAQWVEQHIGKEAATPVAAAFFLAAPEH